MKDSNLPITESDGYVSLEMPISFYEDNIEIFQDNEEIKLKSAYRKQKAPKSDKEYQEKLTAFIQAKNDLLEYEVKMRYKQQIKI